MAKKKKGEKAEPSFVFPEFDRTEWLEKEVRDSKAGLIGVAWALLVGLMSWQLSLATGQARYGLLFGLAACFAIIKILPLIIDTSSFERKSWAGPILTALLAGSLHPALESPLQRHRPAARRRARLLHRG